MSLEELARRVQRLEDVEAIKVLKARYCAACDRGYDAEAIANCYTEHGIWNGDRTFGKVVGRDKIKEFFVGASKRVLIARHQVNEQHKNLRTVKNQRGSKTERKPTTSKR